MLCAGLNVKLTDDASGEVVEWHYEDGLRDYLRGELDGIEALPNELFVHHMARDVEGLEVALAWLPEGELVQESYVNLIPTAQGGTHVNGLRTGLTTAIREFCDIRNLLPRGVKLAPEDVWERLVVRAVGASCRIRSSPARPRSGCPRGRPPAWSRTSSTMPSACGSTRTWRWASALPSWRSSAPARA